MRMSRGVFLAAILVVALAMAFGATGLFTGTGSSPSHGICTADGRPVVRLYSTTMCPHCRWIKDTFDSVVREYASRGEIVAHHWELDTGDDTLSRRVETRVPSEEVWIYQQFNPRSTVPTFVFGCRYYRIGNGYEGRKDLKSEEREFREIIRAMVEGREPALSTFKQP